MRLARRRRRDTIRRVEWVQGGTGRETMGGLGGRQVGFNAASRGEWEAFAEHRGRVSGLLGRGATPGRSRLCVLGAGNANDLDVPALLAAHREVHLVDIDAEALALGAERQGVAGSPGLHLHGGVDVTAALDVLSGLDPRSTVGPAVFDALAAWPASRAAAALPGGFDRVASTCLLSQILETAAHALGRGHRQLGEVEAALLAGHLRLMARLVAPGGEAVLIAEVVSSDTLAELPGMAPDEVSALLPRLGRDGNHFRGVHPEQLLAALRAVPSVGPRITASASLAPWRWRLHARTYLVGAVAFRLGTACGG